MPASKEQPPRRSAARHAAAAHRRSWLPYAGASACAGGPMNRNENARVAGDSAPNDNSRGHIPVSCKRESQNAARVVMPLLV